MGQQMNPWGGLFETYSSSLLNAAGMNIVLELARPVVASAPAVDQRGIPDVDRNEECGEAAIASGLNAVGVAVSALTVAQWLRLALGESSIQSGTTMWTLARFLDHIGCQYRARTVPVGQGFDEAAAANRVALGAVWTRYAAPVVLDPAVGGSIGHWLLGGALHPAVVLSPPSAPVNYPEDNMLSRRMQVVVGGGNGWAPLPADVSPNKVVNVVMDQLRPDAPSIGYRRVPQFSGVATGPDSNSGGPELVFEPFDLDPGDDGVRGFTLWYES